MAQTEFSRRALLAQEKPEFIDAFAEEYKSFILSSACKAINKVVKEHDLEFEVARDAFCEATRNFTEEDGNFYPYAQTVIADRLLDEDDDDYYDVKVENIKQEEEELFNFSDAGPAPVQPVVQTLSKPVKEVHTIKDEINELSTLLAEYKIRFEDIAKNNPSTRKLKDQCIDSAVALAEDDELSDIFLDECRIPSKELAPIAEVPKKVIDKYSKYITFLTLIILGDYPGLQTYCYFIKQRVERR